MRSFLSTLLSLSLLFANAQTITTIAGTGVAGYSGDGGSANAAQLDHPICIKFDHLGNKYIADHYNHVIRKISSSGIITTVAGNGFGAGTTHGGYSGDGGQATNAKLSMPSDVVFDAAGNLYIAEFGNSVIRKVTPSGITSTFAGNGASGYEGDGGPATNAKINDPLGLVFDNEGNLYFSNNGYNVVRKINTLGIISTVAGTGVSGYSGDGGPATAAKVKLTGFLALGPSGELYITDYTNYRIRKIDLSGTISTIAGTGMPGNTGDGGSATAAQIGMPWSVVFDPAGNMYLTDALNYVIQKIDITGIITTIAGNGTQGYSGDGGPATAAQFNVLVNCSAVDTWGNLYIADENNHRIRRITYNTAGIENINETPVQLSTYPNPANENINIVNTTKIETIAIFDVLGHKLSTAITSVNDKEVQINIEQLPAGIYFVNVNGINAGKFVKQ